MIQNGNTILEPKYDNITYLSNTGDFLVETNKKVGIISANRDTKVQIMYDNIELMDSDSGLYLVKMDNKYGVIDIRGNTKIFIENDEIGIDISKFSKNNIKNKYILIDNLIPVRKDKYWALFDKNGNQVTEFKYDSLGYIASSNKEALNLLVIPNYNVLVACKDKKYTLVNASGSELFATVADDIYLSIMGGEKHYYIIINDQRIDAEEWMDVNGITATSARDTNQTRNQTNSEQDNTNHNENRDENNNEDNNEDNNNYENNDNYEEAENNNEGNNNQEQENNNDNYDENNNNDNENNDNNDNGENDQNYENDNNEEND